MSMNYQAPKSDNDNARLDFTRPVKTVSGLPVRILCTDGPGGCEVVGVVAGMVFCWRLDGTISNGWTSDYHLVQAPEKVTGWVFAWRYANTRDYKDWKMASVTGVAPIEGVNQATGIERRGVREVTIEV